MRITLIAALLLVGCSSKTGPQGPQGEAGPQGPAGATGAQGPQGERGDTGAMGATGATGATGEAGATGPQGLQGPQGAVLVLDGGVVVGPPGASVAVTMLTSGDPACTNGGVRITQLSDGGITNLCNGATGAQGVAGPQGQQGATGPQGTQGVQGPPGAQGATGAQGNAGAQGAQGVAGPTGATGAPGVTASLLPNMSVQCVAGGVLLTFADGGTSAVCNGTQGAQGAQGIQGPAGSQGVAGSTGATGSQGPAGPAGPMGATGPTGPPGSVYFVDGGVVGLGSDVTVFAGFTVQTYTGNLGGTPGANAKCNAEYPGTFLCSWGDYSKAETSAVPGGTNAWIDGERSSTGVRDNSNCYVNSNGWTANTSSYLGNTLTPLGRVTNGTCDVQRPIACCNRRRAVSFRGFTAATYTGNLGGTPGANAKCSAEYPGSFLCSWGDYSKAETSSVPGGVNAWIDGERSSTGVRDNSNCYVNSNGWTANTSSYLGNTLTPLGRVTNGGCDVVRPLACCSNN